MTVKPPGGPGATPPIPPEPRAGETTRAPFSLDAGAAAAIAPDLAADVARQVREGTLSVAQAVDAIVDRTLADPALASLGADRLAELREVLRSAVAEDPVLSQLAGQIAR